MPSELSNYMKHWGYYLNEKQFKILFDHLDYDKDGKISYEDFQNSVGSEISPPEFLYFRQQFVPKKFLKWNYDKCWEMTNDYGRYWDLHKRIVYHRAFEWFIMLPKKLGEKYDEFYDKIKEFYTNPDSPTIKMGDFEKLWEEYELKISDLKEMFLEAFPGSSDKNEKILDMSHIEKILYANQINKEYRKIDLSYDEDEEMGDFWGYTGIKFRDNSNLESISYDDFLKLLTDNKLALIFRTIKDIDQENNGYVTTTELEDIIKLHLPPSRNK